MKRHIIGAVLFSAIMAIVMILVGYFSLDWHWIGTLSFTLLIGLCCFLSGDNQNGEGWKFQINDDTFGQTTENCKAINGVIKEKKDKKICEFEIKDDKEEEKEVK